jgi:3-oxoacyl-[acyl-carrier protein] reductase
MTTHAGKIALITGGSNGIGQVIAARLAAEGATVGIADKSDPSATINLIREAGGRGWAAPCDLADPTSIAGFVGKMRKECGAPSIVVHSAAVQFTKPFEELSVAEWRLTQSVNQESMFHLLQLLLPDMKQAHWGRIVILASSTFFVGARLMTHYVTSKGALIGLAHGLAAEIGSFGITINCVAPGLTRTKNAEAGLSEEIFQTVAGLQAIPRNGTPEDQAGLVSFLCSDAASFITGQTFLADGGQGRT